LHDACILNLSSQFNVASCRSNTFMYVRTLSGDLTDDSACERCLEKDESATHIPRDYEAIAYFVTSANFLWNQVSTTKPRKQIPTFHSKCRIDNVLIRRESTIIHRRSQCKGRIILAHHLCIKMNLRDIGWDGVDWIDRTQNRDQWRAFVNTALNLRVP
jgi:hypothetical protein